MSDKDSVLVAGIDCGTNSIRLKVSHVDVHGSEDVLPRMLKVIRLGQGVDQAHRFSDEALQRSYAAANEFSQALRAYPIDGMRFVATSATRDASNREEFEQGIESILGVRPEVISGVEEASLSFLGATSQLKMPRPQAPYLVVDLGGGSTELVRGGDGESQSIDQVQGAFSMDIGSVRMTERHLLSDPPSDEQILEATDDIDAHIDQAFSAIKVGSTGTLIGVSGTITTIAALALGLGEYDRRLIDGARIPFDHALSIDDRLLRMSRAQRSSYKVIHPGRIDVVGGGALVWSRLMVRISQAVREAHGREIDSFLASDHGLLDGIVLDYGRKLLSQ